MKDKMYHYFASFFKFFCPFIKKGRCIYYYCQQKCAAVNVPIYLIVQKTSVVWRRLKLLKYITVYSYLIDGLRQTFIQVN